MKTLASGKSYCSGRRMRMNASASFWVLLLLLLQLFCSTGHALTPRQFSSTSRRQSRTFQQQSPPLHDTSLPEKIRQWPRDLVQGYQLRTSADKWFPIKSVLEVLLAAGTQLAAEYAKRQGRMSVELDFVIAGILTAVYGKYASMWKVAPTKQQEQSALANTTPSPNNTTTSTASDPLLFGSLSVPTNAFQPTMVDGVTVPSFKQRLGSLIVPMAPLFRAGVVAGFVGYSATALMGYLRSWIWTDYVVATQSVPIVYAAVYTGCFMAIFSNLRYQILQGLIEPGLEWMVRPVSIRAVLVITIRIANGLLGSWLAISGMKALGLQKLK